MGSPTHDSDPDAAVEVTGDNTTVNVNGPDDPEPEEDRAASAPVVNPEAEAQAVAEDAQVQAANQQVAGAVAPEEASEAVPGVVPGSVQRSNPDPDSAHGDSSSE